MKSRIAVADFPFEQQPMGKSKARRAKNSEQRKNGVQSGSQHRICADPCADKCADKCPGRGESPATPKIKNERMIFWRDKESLT